VRFAPAPSGYLHVGSARSALFNWLFAKNSGGTFILRIEDTNAELAAPEYYDAITEPLKWLGLEWDEGPYFQSEREALYLNAINMLLQSGNAYFCDCSREQIDQRNKQTGFQGGYDGYCRDRNLDETPEASVRFRTPDQGSIQVTDLIRGEVKFDNAELEDFVIRRANGTPVFLVANAVDDADMDITHVIRGEDLLNTTPKVLLLWDALDYGAPPIYAHLPLLVGEDRKKLSKRRHSVALGDFKDEGILPEAMVNYLALLGWGPSDEKEIRPIEEIVTLFSLESVNKAPAFFDIKKLTHINSHYIAAMGTGVFVDEVSRYINKIGWEPPNFDMTILEILAPFLQQRATRISDVVPLLDWVFEDELPQETDEKELNKMAKAMGAEVVPDILEEAIGRLQDCQWDAETLSKEIREVGDALNAKSQVPVRIAVTGRRTGLPLFEPMAYLSRELVLRRLQTARSNLR
tara:strand:- start:720 stop:2108 length:1389 start_codon:yes stop_codon:yes gene_type:complete